MSPSVVAAGLLAGAGLLCAGALGAARQERFGRALACVFLLGLALRVYASADLYLHEWDERYHMLVAKHLAAHPWKPTLYEDPVLPFDERQWLSNHVWLHKPPLALWILAGGVRVFGSFEPLLRFPSVVISSLAVLLTYALGVRLADRRAALLAAFFHAIHGFLIDLASGRRATDHVDSLFVCLVEMGVFIGFKAAERGHPARLTAAIGMVTGLAILTKSGPALLIVAVWIALMFATKPRPAWRHLARSVAIVSAAAATTALPWLLYTRISFPREAAWEVSYELRHLGEPLEGHAGTLLSHLAWMPRFFGELVYVPVIWFLWRTFFHERRAGWTALAVWLALPYAVFSLVATKMPGYVMIAAPAVFLMQGSVVSWLSKARDLPWPGRLARATLVALLMLLPLRYTVERLRPLTSDDRHRAWADELRALERQLGSGKCVLFGTPRPIEAMFYTHCSAYTNPPASPAVVEALERAGYQVLVRPPA